jgi:DNA-binding transcriptional MocR family regulator
MKFLDLDTSAAEPLYRQIYTRFRSAIAEGLLQPGDRIPAARALALELGLARGTVESAYALLTAEGYVEARGQAGTVVTPALARHAPVAPPPRRALPTTTWAMPPPPPCPSRWAYRRWTPSRARCGRGWPRAPCAPPSRTT